MHKVERERGMGERGDRETQTEIWAETKRAGVRDRQTQRGHLVPKLPGLPGR